MGMQDDVPIVEEWGPWLAVKQTMSSPLPWMGWWVAMAGLICCGRRQTREIGVGCLTASGHYSLALVVVWFSRSILSASCSPAPLDPLRWELLAVLLPVGILSMAALPILRGGGLRRYAAPIASLFIGFCSTTLSIFGIAALIYTPVATLQAILRG